jgi:hypothetical protein
VEEGRGHQLQEARRRVFPDAAGVLDVERGQLAAIRPHFWQTDTAVAKNSWGYTTHQEYKTAASIVEDLVDIVSKNGALLLNIGPRPDGTIPEGDEAILRQIGGWLSTNGEAIYGTRPWRVFGEGPTEVVAGPSPIPRGSPSPRRTSASRPGGHLYATAWPGRPRGDRVRSLARPGGREDSAVAKVDLLGHAEPIPWEQDGRRAGRDAARGQGHHGAPLAAYRLLRDPVESKTSVGGRLLGHLAIAARSDAQEADERAPHHVRAAEPRGRGDLLEAPVRALELAARRLHARLQHVLGRRRARPRA